MEISELSAQIETLWASSALASDKDLVAVRVAVDMLDRGELQVVEQVDDAWVVNEWVKKAILLYFRYRKSQPIEAGDLRFFDKVPLKLDHALAGIRVVPCATVRRGAYVAPGAILMPSFVNIGAWVGTGTLVDTWATVGSCAHIGAHVHLSGGVGIGGVLEPLQAKPVVVEDGCFIGSRAIVVEGAHIGAEAVLGANVVITSSTHIIDVSGPAPKEYCGYVPPRAVVIPGVRQRQFPAGSYGVPCALIIGQRRESTDRKTSLNEVLRDFKLEA